MAGNMEQLASRLDTVREDIERGDQGLEQRLEQRLGAVEKSAHFNTNALDHALEKIEAQANQRAGDMVEAQRRATQTEESLVRLEEAVARLEMRGADPATVQRMDGFERNLADVLSRLPGAERLEDTVNGLVARLDSIENSHRELLDELRTRQQPKFQEPLYTPPQPAPAPMPTPLIEAPPFAEPEAIEPPPFEAPLNDFAADEPVEDDAAADPFAPVSEFIDPFAPAEAEEPENFLAAARRSARAASEAAGAQGAARFGAFRFSREGASRSRVMVPLVIALTVVLALAAGILISARLRNAGTPPAPASNPAAATQEAAPPVSLANPPGADNQAPFVVAPPGHVPAGGPPRTVMPLQQRPVRNAPINAVPGSAPQSANATQQSVPTLDRVVQLANGGNATAQTVIGLRYLDGNGVAANPGEALKWLSKAADAGQAVAQYRLGTMYERGQGVAADPAKAAHWYELAANQGNRKAMHNLAVAYASGALGKKNMAEAARWFSKAAGLGLSDSQFNLAVLYERGDGVPQSLLDAFKWYAIAAAQGDSESKQRLAVLQAQLGDADKAAAQKSAASFHAAPLSRSANVPPELADVSGN
jgi:localization factor PodJL